MSDGLITLNEQELASLQKGEILDKSTIDGGTTVNIRLVVPAGMSHDAVMNRAKKLGFRGKTPNTKPQGQKKPEESTDTPTAPQIPDGNPAGLTAPPNPASAPLDDSAPSGPAEVPIVGGDPPLEPSVPENASVTGPPPVAAPPAVSPETPPTISGGGIVEVEDDPGKLW